MSTSLFCRGKLSHHYSGRILILKLCRSDQRLCPMFTALLSTWAMKSRWKLFSNRSDKTQFLSHSEHLKESRFNISRDSWSILDILIILPVADRASPFCICICRSWCAYNQLYIICIIISHSVTTGHCCVYI